mmetsp:Transcript_15932/g.41305  ORF Transcript_15932/g.41305 Transcript_15932/m.41305 type:complete len:200 (+) Transcript_15932:264-863(+)
MSSSGSIVHPTLVRVRRALTPLLHRVHVVRKRLKARRAAVHVLLKPLHLRAGPHADVRELVVHLQLDGKRGVGFPAPGGEAASFLHQQRHGSDLVAQAQLGGASGRADAGEDALLLNQDLEHIRHHPARVSQRVPLLQVVVDQALIVGAVRGGAEVPWGEELALADGFRLFYVQPLAVILQQELVRPGITTPTAAAACS